MNNDIVTKLQPANLEHLRNESRNLAEKLLEKWPELWDRMFMENAPEGTQLLVKIPSPTGDKNRTIIIWMEDDKDTGIGFGPWHTHGDSWTSSYELEDQIAGIIDVVGAIMADKIVIVREIGGEYHGSEGVIDLRKHCALEEEMTSRFSSGRVSIESFTGTVDRTIGLDDLDL